MKYPNASAKAVVILRKILEANPIVSGVMSRDRQAALELAISVLEGHAIDEGVTENERDFK